MPGKGVQKDLVNAARMCWTSFRVDDGDSVGGNAYIVE